MDKAEIEKILSLTCQRYLVSSNPDHSDLFNDAYSSITALIIKWLESKRKTNVCEFDPRVDIGEINKAEIKGRNQLITELIGELK